MSLRIATLIALVTALLSCNTRVSFPHVAVFSSVEPLMRGDSSRTGFFTTASLFDTTYSFIAYETTSGRVTVPNDGTQNFFLCRYDTATLQPVWIAVARGAGGDGGCNYYTVPPENAVYVTGYFEDTAFFPHRPGAAATDTIISRGYADLFVAKYDYATGDLLWLTSGGSKYADVVFMIGDTRHQETYMSVDSAGLTVYTNCFGPARFGDMQIDARIGGEGVWIRFDKETGTVLGLGHPLSLPKIDAQ